MSTNNARNRIVRFSVLIAMVCLLAAAITGWWGQQEREQSLHETQQKLDRMRDQLDSLQKQLESLKKQAAKPKST